METMKIGIIGSGSWGTALAKIICSNGQKIYWWNRSESTIEQFRQKAHHPHYLSSAKFDMNQISFTTQLKEVIDHSDVLIIAIPAAYVAEVFAALPKNDSIYKIIRNKVIIKHYADSVEYTVGDFYKKNV